MAVSAISVRTYLVVCALLILLTFLTLGVSLFAGRRGPAVRLAAGAGGID